MGQERGVIRPGWEIPVHGANVHWELAAGSAGNIRAQPLIPRATIASVAADIDRRSESCESCDNKESELHCEVSDPGGVT